MGHSPTVPPGASSPQRRLTLADLPPAVATRLAFDEAAPRRFRSSKLPAPVQDDLRNLWNGIIADVYDEVAGLRRRKAFGKDGVERVLRRLADRLQLAERVVIVTAVHYPMRGDKSWKHVTAAGVGGGAAAAVGEVAAVASLGTAATVAIVSAIVGEVFETYVAASARTHQYLDARRSPDPGVIVTDLAESSGFVDATGRRATNRVVHDAASWLGNQLMTRTMSRFAKGIVPVVGVGAGAGMSAMSVRKITRLPLRPVSEDEVLRLADEVRADPESYAAARDRFLALTSEDGTGQRGAGGGADPGPT